MAPGTAVDASDGRHETARVSRQAFDPANPLRGTRQRIPASVHWGRAGVIRRSGERHREAALPGDRVHDSERDSEAVEHGALLDVEFDVADRVGVGARPRAMFDGSSP